MPILSRLVRTLQFSVTIYVVVAILYTTGHFVLHPLHSKISALLSGPKYQGPSGISWANILSGSLISQKLSLDKARGKNQLSFEPSKFPKEAISWGPSDFTTKHIGLKHANDTAILMSEDLFLSKAFSQSMHPSKIIPFFYRAAGEFNKDDITLTTLVTSNRFKVFSQLVEIYQGTFIVLGYILPHIS